MLRFALSSDDSRLIVEEWGGEGRLRKEARFCYFSSIYGTAFLKSLYMDVLALHLLEDEKYILMILLRGSMVTYLLIKMY